MTPPSISLLRALLDGAALPAWVVDGDGYVRYASAALTRFLGGTPASVEGRRITDLVGPELASVYLANNHEVLETGRTVEGREEPPRRDMAAHIVRKFLVIGDGGERLVGGIAIDATDLDRALRKGREIEVRFDRVVESAHEGIWIVDDQWKTTFVNPALMRLLGYTADEMRGRTILDFMPPAERETVARQMAERQGGADAVTESPLVCKDGSIVWTLSGANPLLDDMGSFVGAVAIVTDITERRRAAAENARLEAQMRESQKLESLGLLAGGIAHDFNNLLTGILAGAELTAAHIAKDSRAHESLRLVRDAAHRASELTRQLLAYSGRARFIVRPIDLSALVRTTIDLLRISVRRSARLEFDLAPNLPAIDADASQLHQVVMNLVINASEALRDGMGTVRVRTLMASASSIEGALSPASMPVPAGDCVCLEVADDGLGMSRETMARMFEPFFSTKATGRGLGLAATLGIVRGHRGTIAVNAEPGRGTTFRVLFPASTTDAVDSRDPSLDPVRRPPVGGTALLVDDEPLVRSTVSRMLEHLGFTVHVAADGLDALSVFSAHRPRMSIVLIDLAMPQLDGFATLEELQRIDPAVRAILISGSEEQYATGRGAGKPAVAFLQKPFSIEALGEAVAVALDADEPHKR